MLRFLAIYFKLIYLWLNQKKTITEIFNPIKMADSRFNKLFSIQIWTNLNLNWWYTFSFVWFIFSFFFIAFFFFFCYNMLGFILFFWYDVVRWLRWYFVYKKKNIMMNKNNGETACASILTKPRLKYWSNKNKKKNHEHIYNMEEEKKWNKINDTQHHKSCDIWSHKRWKFYIHGI
jgi:hypothetical protein